MADEPKKQEESQKFMDRRGINIVISAVLFITNFLLMYFICLKAFPDITGIPRMLFSWVGAYAMTWFMSCFTRGVARLILSLIFIGVLYIVMMSQPAGR